MRGRVSILLILVGGIAFLSVMISPSSLASPLTQAPTPTPDPVLKVQADALIKDGEQRYLQGDLQGTLDRWQEALSIYRQIGDQTGEAIALNNLGGLYSVLGEYELALEYLHQALAIHREMNNRAEEGTTLKNIGWAFEGMGQYQRALEYFQQALAIWQDIQDRVEEAKTLKLIARAYQALWNYEEALEYYQRCLVVAQKIEDRVQQHTTLRLMGQIYYLLGENEAALMHLRQALAIAQHMDDQMEAGLILNNIGSIYLDLGGQEHALAHFQQALTIAQEVSDREVEAAALNGIGEAYRNVGEYEQALKYHHQSLVIAQRNGLKEGEGTVLNNIGLAYHTLGDFRQALDSLQQALAIAEEIGDREAEGNRLNSIGMVYSSLGDFRQALDYFQQGRTILHEVGAVRREAAVLSNIGMVYQSQGDYQQALKYCHEALAIHHQIGDHAGEAKTLDNIVAIYLELGNLDQALDYYGQALASVGVDDPQIKWAMLNNIGVLGAKLGMYQQALEDFQATLTIARQIGDQSKEATTLNNIGTVYNDLEKYQEALKYFQMALTIARQIGDRPGEVIPLINTGWAYNKVGEYQQALSYNQQASIITRQIGDRATQATILGDIGFLYEQQGEDTKALDYYLQAVDILDEIKADITVEELGRSFTTQRMDVYARAVFTLLRQNQPTEAFYYAERSRARTFLTFLGNQRVDPKGSEDPDLIQREVQMRGELAALEQQLREEWSKPADQRSQQVIDHINANLEARRQEYKNLLIQLQLTNPDYAALVRVDPLTLEEAQTLLREQAPDVTLVAYFIGEEETIIFVLGPDTFHAQAVLVTRQELRQQGEALLAEMNVEPMQPQYWQVLAQALHEWLITPVQDYLPPANSDAPPRLGIIPHDLFHYLPFNLLYDGKSTLLEGYTLFYTPSVSSLRFVFEKRHSQADTLLAFANPDVPGESHLHYAEEEAWAVATLYETQPFVGPKATEGRFKAQAGEHSLVHVAAHSDYNSRSPLFSAILLTGDENEDGRLETHEVFNLDMPQTDLVVLSACQTHTGTLSTGDELVGLERAFVRAGSPSLLTTLWPVDDAATAALMEQFYTRLRAGVPKAEALRLAQLKTQAEHLEPYYWAGFVLVGDCGGEPISPGETGEQLPSPPWAGPLCGAGLCGCTGIAIIFGGKVIFRWRRRRRGSGRERAK